MLPAPRVVADEAEQRRGKLKVFLGAAPGVGKTFTMLGSARELHKQGVDIVVGVVETHGRKETEALVAGLEDIQHHETVPDAFLDRLRDVVLIDLPPRELIERLRQGKGYVPERAQAALDCFFSPTNLAALRELAMQTAANLVDADLRDDLAANT